MKNVFRRIRLRAGELARHSLFAWLARTDVPASQKFVFAPMALDFIMGFRDLNKYYIKYENPSDEREIAINTHAAEDEVHSALLMQDWASLGLDDAFGWAPRDVFWWLTCDETLGARRVDFELTSMVFHHSDPLLRFAIIESMEAAGNVFFTRTMPIAEGLAETIGKPLPYFGKFHFDRETGHLQGADERPFLRASLDEAALERACSLVDRVFEIFQFHFSTWERFADEKVRGALSYSPQAAGRASADVLRADDVEDVSRFLLLSHPRDLHGDALALATERQRAYDELWRSPGYVWIREAFPGKFRTMMRYFFLQWVVDNWACADYFTFDTVYEDPKTPLERGINRLSEIYASEMQRRYVEWETLDLDTFTGWGARDALQHYWLDERVEGNREVFADLRKLTFRYPKPLHRYWIMKCFVRFGDTLMRSLGVAMKNSGEPDENFITFAGHPERLHPDLPPDPEADRAIEELEREPLDAEDVAILREIIAETKAQEAKRADLTWIVVHEKRFHAFHERYVASKSHGPVVSTHEVRPPMHEIRQKKEVSR